MKRRFLNGVLWGLLLLLVSSTALFFYGSLAYSNHQLNIELSRRKDANRELAAQLELARQENLPREEIAELKRKGLREPIAALLADLQKHPPRIPQRGVLGGTMTFGGEDEVRFLGDGWVFAGFDDGHILGKALLKYEVKDGGKISWKTVGSVLE